jgi:multiple antibiotic resistance protein
MNLDLPLVLNFFIAMLAILNPIGNVPIFLQHVSEESLEVQKNIARLMSITIFIIAVFFYFLGQPFLQIFGITIPAFRIAGAILLMMIGIRLLHGKSKFDDSSLQTQTPGANAFVQAKQKLSSIIVPVAIPIFVGPGAVTTVILYSQRSESGLTTFFMICAIAAACYIIGIVLSLSRWVSKRLGHNGMQIVSRTMGLILCAIAAQFAIEGIAQLIPNLFDPQFVHTLK